MPLSGCRPGHIPCLDATKCIPMFKLVAKFLSGITIDEIFLGSAMEFRSASTIAPMNFTLSATSILNALSPIFCDILST